MANKNEPTLATISHRIYLAGFLGGMGFTLGLLALIVSILVLTGSLP